jgi:hypothetical protein
MAVDAAFLSYIDVVSIFSFELPWVTTAINPGDLQHLLQKSSIEYE